MTKFNFGAISSSSEPVSFFLFISGMLHSRLKLQRRLLKPDLFKFVLPNGTISFKLLTARLRYSCFLSLLLLDS